MQINPTSGNKIDLNSEGENFFKFSPLVLPKLPPTLEHLILVGIFFPFKKINTYL